jgi:hypothetical protein
VNLGGINISFPGRRADARGVASARPVITNTRASGGNVRLQRSRSLNPIFVHGRPSSSPNFGGLPES